MSTVPPSSHPRFFLGRVAGVLMVISAAVHVLAGLWTPGHSAQVIGRDLGVFLLGFLLSLGLSGVAWRLSGRRRLGAVVFCILIVCLALARLAGAFVVQRAADQNRLAVAHNLQSMEAYRHEALRRAEALAAGTKNESPDGDSKFVGQGADLLRESARTAHGNERKSLEVLALIMDDFQNKVRFYESAGNELKAVGYATAVGLNSPGDIVRRRVLVKNCTDANNVLTTAYRDLESTVRTELRPLVGEARADEAARQIAAGWNMPTVMGIRDCERRRLESLDGVLALYYDEFSHWHLNADRKIVFDHPSAVPRHKQWMAQLKDAEREGTLLRQQGGERLKQMQTSAATPSASLSPAPAATR